QAASHMDASADANGRTVDNTISGTGIAAAVAINVANTTTAASIAGKASANSITIETVMAGDGRHSYSASASSGAGANAESFAGALAVNVPTGSSDARLENGASLTLASGKLTIHARYATRNEAKAVSTASGESAVGIGG